MNYFKKPVIFILSALAVVFIILSQQKPYFIDLSAKPPSTESASLSQYLSAIDTPIKLTFFTSKDLYSEYELLKFSLWAQQLSSMITIDIIDPYERPDLSDQYDIKSDGVIVIEHNENRQDLHILDHALLDQNNLLNTLQNSLIRVIIQLSDLAKLNALLIHDGMDDLFSSYTPMGLSLFKSIFDHNFITISEWSLFSSELPESVNYNIVILYKLTDLSPSSIETIRNFSQISDKLIIFNHPKLPLDTDSLELDIQASFLPGIIEDPTASMIHSDNQLIVNFISDEHDSLIGVFPYSGGIQLNSEQAKSYINTSEDAFISDDVTIKGPFSIAAQYNQSLLLINNYLTPTNYWIQHGDNYQILHHLITDSLIDYPSIKARDTSDDFIVLTWFNLIKMIFLLLVSPVIIYCLADIFRSRSLKLPK